MRKDERTAQIKSEMTFWPNRASPGWGKTQRPHWVLFSVLPGDELWAETSPLISFLHLSRAAVPQPGFIQKPLDEPPVLESCSSHRPQKRCSSSSLGTRPQPKRSHCQTMLDSISSSPKELLGDLGRVPNCSVPQFPTHNKEIIKQP